MTGNKMKISKNLYFDIPNVILKVITDHMSAPKDKRSKVTKSVSFKYLVPYHCVEQKNSQLIMYNEISHTTNGS